jgi:predicted GIY-YIG superfamily endonuclease
MEWWVYLVRCADDSLYCGIAIHPERREHDHNHTNKGAAYTRSRRPVSLVWKEKAGTKSQALKREAAIKKMSKEEKEALVASYTPELEIFQGTDIQTDDPNIKMLWDSLTLVKSMGKKPILWKLNPELTKSVCEYLGKPWDRIARGSLWRIPVDVSSANSGLIVEGEIFPLIRA